MTIQDAVLDGPAPELIFKRRLRPWAMLRELWGAREMVRSLTERELRVRYKQTKMGYAWAVLTPLLTMGAAMLLSSAVDLRVDYEPKALYFYVGVLPWTAFATSLTMGGLSIITNLALINKVYCPREVFPIASICTAVVDMTVASSILAVLFASYGVMPEATIVWVPALFAVQLIFTTGVLLLISALVVYLRDLRHVLPMIVQFGMFATPVMYPFGHWPIADALGERAAAVVNPLGPVIDGYRRTVLEGKAPAMGLFAVAAVASLAMLVVGYGLFKRLEANFADIA